MSKTLPTCFPTERLSIISCLSHSFLVNNSSCGAATADQVFCATSPFLSMKFTKKVVLLLPSYRCAGLHIPLWCHLSGLPASASSTSCICLLSDFVCFRFCIGFIQLFEFFPLLLHIRVPLFQRFHRRSSSSRVLSLFSLLSVQICLDFLECQESVICCASLKFCLRLFHCFVFVLHRVFVESSSSCSTHDVGPHIRMDSVVQP